MTFAGIVAGMIFLRDISLLIARVILGVVLIAHGWQKYNDWKIEGTGKSFDGMGVPYPELSAQIATYFELIGGVLLIIGLLVRLVGPILFVQMLGAFWFAHRDGGVFVSDGGWELVAVIGAAGLALAGAGAGRISLDYLLMTPLRRRRQAKESKMMVAAPATGAAPAGDYSPVTDSPAKRDSHTPSASTSPSASARNAADADFAGTDRTSGLNSGRGIDPDAPTTQWPGNSRKI